ncbi:MAG: hypothetical protein V2G33_07510 [bacterium JZ-2024 1]
MRLLIWRCLMVLSFVLFCIRIVFSLEGGEQKAKEPKPLKTMPAVSLSSIMTEWERTYQQGIKYAQSIQDEKSRLRTFRDIAEAMKRAGENEKALTIITQVLQEASGIKDESDRSPALLDIVQAMGYLGLAEVDLFNKAYQSALSFQGETERDVMFRVIAEAMAKAGKAQGNITMLNHALQIAQNIKDSFHRAFALSSIAEAMAQAGERQTAVHLFDQALQDAQSIEDEAFYERTLRGIVNSLEKGNVSEEDLFHRAFHIALSIKNEFSRSKALLDIAKVTAKSGLLPLALQVAQSIEKEPDRSSAISHTAEAMAKAGKKEEAIVLLTRALQAAPSIGNESDRASALSLLVRQMAKVGLAGKYLFNQALQIAVSIKDEKGRFTALSGIALSMAETGERRKAVTILKQAFQAAKNIQDEYERSFAVRSAIFVMEEGNLTEAGLFNQALQIALSIKDRSERTPALRSIALAMARSGERQKAITVFKQALQSAKGIEKEHALSEEFYSIAFDMADADLVKEDLFHRTLQIAQSLKYESYRSKALRDIATVMARKGFLDQAYTAAMSIEEPIPRLDALAEIIWRLRQAGML